MNVGEGEAGPHVDFHLYGKLDSASGCKALRTATGPVRARRLEASSKMPF